MGCSLWVRDLIPTSTVLCLMFLHGPLQNLQKHRRLQIQCDRNSKAQNLSYTYALRRQCRIHQLAPWLVGFICTSFVICLDLFRGRTPHLLYRSTLMTFSINNTLSLSLRCRKLKSEIVDKWHGCSVSWFSGKHRPNAELRMVCYIVGRDGVVVGRTYKAASENCHQIFCAKIESIVINLS